MLLCHILSLGLESNSLHTQTSLVKLPCKLSLGAPQLHPHVPQAEPLQTSLHLSLNARPLSDVRIRWKIRSWLLP